VSHLCHTCVTPVPHNREGKRMRIKPIAAGFLAGAFLLSGCASAPNASDAGDGSSAEELIAAGVMDDNAVLTEQQTITLAAATATSFTIPLFMAESGYESFAKRNLTVEVETLSQVDAFPLMAKGELDGNFGAPDVGLFNSIHSGNDIAVVAPS